MKLSDIFTIVLENAIEAQYRANIYSANLAKNPAVRISKPEAPGVHKDDSFYPIPNSAFQSINVDLKVKLKDIETDVVKTYQQTLGHLLHVQVDIADMDSIRQVTRTAHLATALAELGLKWDEDQLVPNVLRYMSLYLVTFENALHNNSRKQTSDDLQITGWKVLQETQDLMKQEPGNEGERYHSIYESLQAAAANLHPFKNMVFQVSDQPDDPNQLCTLSLNLDMRTFSWANYDNR